MAAGDSYSFADATRNRYESRPFTRSAIRNTMLLKGLEATVAVITAPEEMDVRHIYAAFTRGPKKRAVCC